jgi:iron complex outermembrane receptor protein
VTADDKYYYKKASPDFLFGVSTQVAYKKFSLGLAGHASVGNYMYNNVNSSKAVYRNIENPTNFIGNTTADYLNTGFFNNQYWSDYFIENASFFRLDNINLGYNAGRIFNEKASLRIAASIQNVFVITDYSGLDPEISNDGIDRQLYPRPRVFSLGFNLDF